MNSNLLATNFYSHIPEKEWDSKLEECLSEIENCDEWEEFLGIFHR